MDVADKTTPAIDRKYKIRNTILLEPALFYSDAFKALSKSAIITLLRCLQKRKWSRGKIAGVKTTVYHNDGFIFPYDEAEFLGIRTTQHWKNIKSLIALGFLDLVHQGGWYQKNEKQKDYSVYKLSDRWKLYGTAEFKIVEKQRVLSPEYFIKKNLEKKSLRATSQKRSGQLHKREGDRPKRSKGRLHKSEVDKVSEKPAQRLDNAV